MFQGGAHSGNAIGEGRNDEISEVVRKRDNGRKGLVRCLIRKRGAGTVKLVPGTYDACRHCW